MKLDIHVGGRFVRPVSFEDVSAVQIRSDKGTLMGLAFEIDGRICIVTAADKEFSALCNNYGIVAEPAKLVEVPAPGA
jgi:hypothetical protein